MSNFAERVRALFPILSYRLPKGTDSTEVVRYARQSVLLTLVVSATVIVSLFYYDTETFRRASNELSIVQLLATDLTNEALSNRSNTLSRILGGADVRRSEQYETYTLTLSEISTSSSIGHEPLRCTVTFALNEYLLIPDDTPSRLLLISRRTPPAQQVVEGARFWRTREDLGRIPRTLAGFSTLWNDVFGRTTAAFMTAVIPDIALARRGSTFYRVTKAKREEMRKDAIGVIPPRFILKVDGANGKHDGPLKDATHGALKIPDDIFDEWGQRRVEALTQAECGAKRGGVTNFYTITMPVNWTKREFNWADKWMRRAIGTRYFDLPASVRSNPFSEAFPHLWRKAERIAIASLDDIQKYFQQNSGVDISRDAPPITVLGLGIPVNPLLNVGVILIVLFQLHGARHVAQAASLLSRNGSEDPAVLTPWIMLYDGRVAVVGTVFVSFVPLLATLLVIERIYTGGEILSAWGLVNLSGLPVTAVLGTWCCISASKLRAVACPPGRARA